MSLVFTSAFDNIANNLPLEPVWLPFLDQTTHEMGGIGTAPGNYKVGSFVELRTAKEKNVPVEIVGPDNKRAADAGGIHQSDARSSSRRRAFSTSGARMGGKNWRR